MGLSGHNLCKLRKICIYLVFASSSWHQNCNFLSYRGDRGIFLFSIISPFQPDMCGCYWDDWLDAPDSFRIGAGFQRNQLCNWRVGIFSYTLQSPGRGERLRIELITSGQWFNQSCQHNGTFMKTLHKGAWRAFWVVGCIHVPGGWHNQHQGDRSSCVRVASGLCSVCLFKCLFICILYDILYIKLGTVSKMFPWVLCYHRKLLSLREGVMVIPSL